jgi:signal transduction histidine kinase/ligand-binding sensor domain-containing protein
MRENLRRLSRLPWPVALLTCLVLAPCPATFALNPTLDATQYAHTAWRIRDGFTKGTIVPVAQTQDGYLWLGTEFDLLRFDGVRAVSWTPPGGEQLPGYFIRSLLATRDGSLWIGTSAGLASWKSGKFAIYPELAGQSVGALIEDHKGTVWAGGHGTPAAKLCAIRSAEIQCNGEDGSFGQYIDALFEDQAGRIWVGGANGLWRWKPGPLKFYAMPDRVRDFVQGENGALIIVMYSGIRQLIGDRLEVLALPAAGRRFSPRVALRDRDGGLWIGTTDQGVVHIRQGRADVFDRTNGLSGNFIERLFEDAEGNIWVSTLDGLDRFRELAIPTISVAQGLSNTTVKSVLAAKDGSVWLGTNDGLNRWKDGQITVHRFGKSTPRSLNSPPVLDDMIETLFEDSRGRLWITSRRGVTVREKGEFSTIDSVPGDVFSMAEDDTGDVWLGQDDALYRLRARQVIERIAWSNLGQTGYARLAADPAGGGLWLAFRTAIAYFKEGRITASYPIADGIARTQVADIQNDADGTVWVATGNGLTRLKNGRVATLSGRNGLPCETVHWAARDDQDSIWMYLACGLVRVRRADLDAWFDAGDSNRRIQSVVFDASDGIRSHATGTGYSPSVSKSPDGRLWLLPWDGVSVIDPRHLPFNNLSPPVRIEQVTVDRKSHSPDPVGSMRLPALTRDLQIDYTALSLAAPEKVKFRYKLEGWDRDWQDAGNRRQAFYTNLSPRTYTFRVIACNNSGVWNETGASLNFEIAPAYYQTAGFQAACIAAFLVCIGVLFQLRQRQATRQFNIRLEERINERVRIARDLHDTLLQSFQGVVMKFSVATDLIARRPDEAQRQLEGILEQARDAIDEGRQAVQGLRSSTVVTNDLAAAITSLGEGFIAGETDRGGPEFRVRIEGASRDLAPLVRDEVYRVTSEAIHNAFRHASATLIEVEIGYTQRQLRLSVKDNGKGIDPEVLTAGGRAGHYGLAGMHERARLAGGKLTLLSKQGLGTEVVLTIPAAFAYLRTPSRRSASLKD